MKRWSHSLSSDPLDWQKFSSLLSPNYLRFTRTESSEIPSSALFAELISSYLNKRLSTFHGISDRYWERLQDIHLNLLNDNRREFESTLFSEEVPSLAFTSDLTDDSPKYLIALLPTFPDEIEAAIDTMQEDRTQESLLYEAAETILSWIQGNIESNEFQMVLLSILQLLPPSGVRVLLASLADNVVHVKNPSLVKKIAEHLFSDNKRIAQAAALCLLKCADRAGSEILKTSISANPPNAKLLAGILKMKIFTFGA